ncbi:LacI family transcriptional regulator [Rhodobacteraceae bacterium]|nr:LacI family transcriptional regulator [Paracoccaceae bacterium]
MRKAKIHSMEELSATIGISRPTLSRYFQNPESVRASTARKISDAMETLDYVPNFFATRLNRKATGMLGVVIPHATDLFFASLLEQIEIVAAELGYTVFTQSSHGSPEMESRAIEQLLSMNADGVLVAPLGGQSRLESLDRLRRNLPMVLVDSAIPGLDDVDFVGTDNHQSIKMIGEYLLRTGHAPTFLGMPRLNANAAAREVAYIELMEERGLEPVVIRGQSVGDSWHFEAYAHDVMEEHFAQGRHVSGALLCANDRLAIGALRAATRFGLTGENGLRIAGHDDHPLSRFMTPALTTVAQDIPAIAAAALRLVTDQIKGDAHDLPPRRETFATRLIIRESA